MFKINYQNKELNLEVDKTELHLWSAHVLDREKIGVFVKIETKVKQTKWVSTYQPYHF